MKKKADKSRRKNTHTKKEKIYKTESKEVPANPIPSLPSRLFPIDGLPEGCRLNIHSKPEYLGALVEVLEGTEALEQIKGSQFGKLFEFPVSRCPHSAKLIHGMLARQLVTKKKHELWFVYGGFPIRFSLREFHITTGLNCGPLPPEAVVEDHQDPSCSSVWISLFGYKRIVTIKDVLEMLKGDMMADPKNRFSHWKRISLALIVIVDGVVVCTNSNAGRVSEDYVEMLADTEFFLSYPWGRLSFKETLSRFGPVFGKDDPFGELKRRLSQQTSLCYGFPLALQLQVLNSIPALCCKLKEPMDFRNFMQRSSDLIFNTILLRESDVNDAELSPTLSVQYTLFHARDINEAEISWDDEESDPQVDMIMSLISKNHKFIPTQWPVWDLPSRESVDVDSDVEDVTPLDPPMKKQKIERVPLGRKPFTRSASKVKEVSKPPLERRQTGAKPNQNRASSSGDNCRPLSPQQYVTHSDIDLLKNWIVTQLETQRKNIYADMKELLGSVGKSPASVHDPLVNDCKGLETNYDGLGTPKQPPNGRQKAGTSSIPGEPQPSSGRFVGDESWETYVTAKVTSVQMGDPLTQGTDGTKHNPTNVFSTGDHARVEDAEPNTQSRDEDDETKQFMDQVVEDCKGLETNSDGRGTPKQPHGGRQKAGTSSTPAETQPSSGRFIGDESWEMYGLAKEISLQMGEHSSQEAEPKTQSRDEDDETNKFMDQVVEDSMDASRGLNPSPSSTPVQVAADSSDGATSEEVSNNLNLSAMVAISPAIFVHETTKLRHAFPPKRIPRRSRFLDDEEFTADPRIKALFGSRKKKPAYTPHAVVDESEFQRWKELLEEAKDQSYTVCTGHKLSNSHFLDIATKGKWITTEHMQVLTSMILRRRAQAFAAKRVVFLETWFLDLLVTHHQDFCSSEDKDNYNWGPSIKAYVTGRSTGKLMKSGFLTNVDVIYVPMSWGRTNWVGLVINLKHRTVEILDPFIEPFGDDVLAFEMRPVVECIPWLLKRWNKPELTANLTTDPFTWSRSRGLYDNKGDGDCGPISVKFLEMHSFGMSMSDMPALTDDAVVRIRHSYAIDSYVTFVEGEDD